MSKMITRKNIIYKIVVAFLVSLLFVLIWVEEKPDKKEEISIVVYEAGANGWDSLQEGIRQAAEDFSVNTKFIVMKENASAAEQMEIIRKEIEDGAQGILLAADDSEDIKWALEKNAPVTPIVAIESGMEDSDIPCVSADDYAMGQHLAEEILADYSAQEELRIVLNDSEAQRQNIKMRRQGFLDFVGEQAQVIFYDEWDKKEADVVAALHKTGLQDIVENADTFPGTVKIYGIGGTAPIVAALDRGEVEKIVFQNEFNVGYLGMDMLIKQVQNKKTKEVPQIDFYCVSRDDLYDTQYEQLLFTIIE